MDVAQIFLRLFALCIACTLHSAQCTNISSQVPVVLWHGMGDTCCNPTSLGRISKILSDNLDGVYVKSLRLGTSIIDETLNGFFSDMNTLVEDACRQIATDERLTNGYHALGFSQGGQFMRAVAERCPTPQMKNLITFGGQHQGVYGLPNCEWSVCNVIRRLLNGDAYLNWIQKISVQAQYWHDPLNEKRYRDYNLFLADINNEREPRNKNYAENLAKLEKFVLIRFNNDTMVVPKQSEWFEFYEAGQSTKILPLNESAIYTEDWIGLKRLDEEGRLIRIAIDGEHLQFTESWFISEIIDKYLKNSDE